ncbi:hypothetical protein NONO_c24730 [Nocardia nova SH22a]|uniref:Uncharacterized protein n=1 Tax=Nocardia nova SH22a TaxID=1415166 RepID=W5TDM0_9NOCA|nr:hypothetical protein [Nocardia nova]AHH17269.1 hypothetical protein NONO_c24730 [Nocardia nova SH22a]
MIVTTVAVVVEVFAAGMVLWRVSSPRTFERWITRSPRAGLLGWWRYRRVWRRRMTACGLHIVHGDAVLIPRLRAVRIGSTSDRVTVGMLHGQSPQQYENQASDIAEAFGVPACRASLIGPSTVEIVVHQTDSDAGPLVPVRVESRWKDAA